MANYFLKRGQFRNYALIVVGTCTALRISDLLKLKWTDVYDEKQRVFHTHVTIVEMKTGKAKTIALNKQVLQAYRQSVRREKYFSAVLHKTYRNTARIERTAGQCRMSDNDGRISFAR